jgi:hypothetical protein
LNLPREEVRGVVARAALLLAAKETNQKKFRRCKK